MIWVTLITISLAIGALSVRVIEWYYDPLSDIITYQRELIQELTRENHDLRELALMDEDRDVRIVPRPSESPLDC